MKEALESYGVIVARTGGVALLVSFPIIPFILFFGGLMAVGRGIWGRGTESRHRSWAQKILAAPRTPGDEFYRSIAESTLDYDM